MKCMSMCWTEIQLGHMSRDRLGPERRSGSFSDDWNAIPVKIYRLTWQLFRTGSLQHAYEYFRLLELRQYMTFNKVLNFLLTLVKNIICECNIGYWCK